LDEDEPKLLPIEPYQNLDLLVQRGVAAYLFARQNGAEPERLSMLRDLIDQASAMKTASMPPPSPNPGQPPAQAPQGGGGSPTFNSPQMGDLNVNVAGPQAAPAVAPLLAA
jgi:hypothetical protein